MAVDSGDQMLMRVIARATAATDVAQIDLVAADDSALPPWAPGAHIEVRLPSGLLRQYSLCGSPADRHCYRICVLREQSGRGGSAEVHDCLEVGTTVSVRIPRNNFPLVDADSYLFVAGGIGITPIKAMVDEVQRRGGDWTLAYGGRTLQSMAFAEELSACGGDRVELIPQDARGLPDIDKLVAEIDDATQVYCCGPAGLIDRVMQVCANGGLSHRLHVERFTASSDVLDESGNTAFDVELRASSVTLHIGATETLLERVRAVRGDVEFSCTEGYCGSCETRVLAGQPDHRGSLMSPEEHDEEGTMLICVGRSKSPLLVLDL